MLTRNPNDLATCHTPPSQTVSPPAACLQTTTPAKNSRIRKSCFLPSPVCLSFRLSDSSYLCSMLKSVWDWKSSAILIHCSSGAFTPGCSVRHLPGYLEKYSALKEKGVDIVAVIAMNDAWVMDAWRKANGVKGDGIVRVFSCSFTVIGTPHSRRLTTLNSCSWQILVSPFPKRSAGPKVLSVQGGMR